jgi:hypothetical protein
MSRKRAPGAGRKPKGDAAMPSFTWRMPADLRKQLETAAKKSGLNLSDELLRRLRASFIVEHERRRDPATRALTFLISTAVQWIAFQPSPQSWHRDRFLYEAFFHAVQLILAALMPPGEALAPHDELLADMENTPGMENSAAMMREETKTPEAAGEYAAGVILRQLFRNIASAEELQQHAVKRSAPPEIKDFLDQFSYGMGNARHDLGIKPKEPKQ